MSCAHRTVHAVSESVSGPTAPLTDDTVVPAASLRALGWTDDDLDAAGVPRDWLSPSFVIVCDDCGEKQ